MSISEKIWRIWRLTNYSRDWLADKDLMKLANQNKEAAAALHQANLDLAEILELSHEVAVALSGEPMEGQDSLSLKPRKAKSLYLERCEQARALGVELRKLAIYAGATPKELACKNPNADEMMHAAGILGYLPSFDSTPGAMTALLAGYRTGKMKDEEEE